jgi:hypothetical protein
MTKDDIASMAREAGIRDCTCNGEFGCIERFADLVAAHERKACAKACEPKRPRPCDCERCDCGNATDARMVAEWDEAFNRAAAIRARGQA